MAQPHQRTADVTDENVGASQSHQNILLAHPTGNQFFRHLAAGFAAQDRLGRVASCVNFNACLDSLSAFLPSGVRGELERRAFRESWAQDLRTHPGREIGRIFAQRLGWARGYRAESSLFSVDAVYQNFDRWLARNLPRWQQEAELSGVYVYEDGALATFTAARKLGLKCCYDLPIAYWETGRRLMTEEAIRLPSWAPTLGGGTSDSPAKLERKNRELELADLVVCPSQFVVDSLPSWARSKQVVLAPFGSPETAACPPLAGPLTSDLSARTSLHLAPRSSPMQRKLRVLFAGSMGQRKGLADLFAAIRVLNRSDVELVVMGSLLAPMEFYRRELPDFTYEPGRPHEQVLALMRSCDVLCLPSIVEGRALVMQEAMSQGLPIVITRNTGGADLIEEGRTGFLVPIRSPELIAEKIAWCAEHRDEVREMGQAARIKASTYTWREYAQRIFDSLPIATRANN